MKKMLMVLPFLLALLGCGDDSTKPKREFQVKSAPKDESAALMEKTIAEQAKRLKMMEDMVTELKAKQDQVDNTLEIYELAKKNRKDPNK